MQLEQAAKINLNAVSLQKAVLCVDCETVSDSAHEACAVCGSHSLLNVARVLGGVLPELRANRAAEQTQQETRKEHSELLVLTCPPDHPHRRRRRSVRRP